MKKIFLLSLFALLLTNVTGWAQTLTQDTDGNYQIASAADWDAFADLVNVGGMTISAVLTQDVTLTTSSKIIGTDFFWSGTFDGRGHKLTVNMDGSVFITFTDHTYHQVAPFGKINGATIQNLHITGSITTDGIRSGIASIVSGGTNTFRNIYNDIDFTINLCTSGWNDTGSFVGKVIDNYTTLNIIDCVFYGTMTGTGKNIAGFVGWQSKTKATVNLSNCLFAPQSISLVNNQSSPDVCYTFVNVTGSASSYSFSNCHYTTQLNNAQGLLASTSAIADGTMATELQNGRSQSIWVQDNVNHHPKLTFSTNYNLLEQDGSGNYLIDSVEDWDAFADLVNGGSTTISAALAQDVTLTRHSKIIGNSTSQKWSGTFDGKGHKLTVNMDGTVYVKEGYSFKQVAPFGFISGATIKNLHISGSITTDGIRSGIASYVSGGTNTFRNIYNDIHFTVNRLNDWCDTGAFAGKVHNNSTTVIIEDCAFYGTMSGTATEVGGFVGWQDGSGGTTVNVANCLFAPQSLTLDYNYSSSKPSYTFVNIDNVYPGSTRSITNCYFTTALNTAQGESASSSDISNGSTTNALQAARAETMWVQAANGPMLKTFVDKTMTANSVNSTDYYSTFYSSASNYEIPLGVEAYIGKVSGSNLALTKLTGGVIPASCAVILKGSNPGLGLMATATDASDNVSENQLQGVDVATTCVAGENYVLSSISSTVGFYKYSGTTLGANKAYLPASVVPSSARTRGLTFDFGDGTTSIHNEECIMHNSGDGIVYDLQGRRVEHPKKGLYIVNGKKMVIK